MLMLALPGSAYLYQGEELGLFEVADLPAGVLADPVWRRTGGEIKGRDGCRVPLPWTSTGPSFGFGEDGAHLPQPAWFGSMSVQAQESAAESTLNLYRSALAFGASGRLVGRWNGWIRRRQPCVCRGPAAGIRSPTSPPSRFSCRPARSCSRATLSLVASPGMPPPGCWRSGSGGRRCASAEAVPAVFEGGQRPNRPRLDTVCRRDRLHILACGHRVQLRRVPQARDCLENSAAYPLGFLEPAAGAQSPQPSQQSNGQTAPRW